MDKKNEDINTKLFKEMFKKVGSKYKKKKVSTPNWCSLYSWTFDDQTSFQRWGAKYLMDKKGYPEKHADTYMAYFIQNYGWDVTGEIPRNEEDVEKAKRYLGGLK